MKMAFTDPALTTKGDIGFFIPLTEFIGIDIGANTTIVLGDYGMFKNIANKPPIWFNMIMFWQVGARIGLDVAF